MKTYRLENGNKGNRSATVQQHASGFSVAIRNRIQATRKEILQHHLPLIPRDKHFLTLALNEAEALAFQTDYPHLVFPVLALEKVQAAISWQHRQDAIHGYVESAFAV